MTKFPDSLEEIMATLAPSHKTVTVDTRDEALLDRMADAFHAEADRWGWRRNDPHFEIIRNSSPKNDIIDDEYFQVTRLTKRECPDRHTADAFLNCYRDRASMLAALRTLR